MEEGADDVLYVYQHHEPDGPEDPEDRLPGVVKKMKAMGPPKIRVVEHSGRFYAMEGVHRLAAADLLRMSPHFLVVGEDLAETVYVDDLLEEGDGRGGETTVRSMVETFVYNALSNETQPLVFPASCPRTDAECCDKCRALHFPSVVPCRCKT